MYKDSNCFDTSLFERNFPKVAQDVRKVCLDLGFKGLSHIKIPYIAARTFAAEKGTTYDELSKFIVLVQRSEQEKYLQTHYHVLEEYVVASTSYPTFMHRMKFANQDFDTKAQKRMNKVYYGIFKEPVYGG